MFRHAVLNGFDVEIFDKRNAVGGRWSLDSLNGVVVVARLTLFDFNFRSISA